MLIKSILVLWIFAVPLLTISCMSEESPSHSIEADSIKKELGEWKAWAESSDNGLWEGNASHSLSLELLNVYGGEENTIPAFFSVESFDVSGDTIFISDKQAQQLVAINFQGCVLWKSGGLGEGPGFFSGIAQLDVNSEYIAVANAGNARVDLFSRSGEWVNSISVLTPYDVDFLNDSVLVVVTQTSPEGFLRVFNLTGDIISVSGQWATHLEGWTANRDLHCKAIDECHIVVNSWYSNRNEIHSLVSPDSVLFFNRILPVDIPEPSGSGGMVSFNTFLLDVCVGPEGMINVLLRPFTTDRTIKIQGDNIARVGIVDRFDREGNYLDSYVIPTTCGEMIYYNGELFVSNWIECSIYRYKVIYSTN